MSDLTVAECAEMLGMPPDSDPATLLKIMAQATGGQQPDRSGETSNNARYWAERCIDTAIGEGKIAASQREFWVNQFAADPNRWADYIEALPAMPEAAPSARTGAGRFESETDTLYREMGY